MISQLIFLKTVKKKKIKEKSLNNGKIYCLRIFDHGKSNFCHQKLNKIMMIGIRYFQFFILKA